MLVLSRKQKESIHISDNVVVTVLEIRGNRVRLGIDAPQGVPVHRTEIHEMLSRPPSRPPPDLEKVPVALIVASSAQHGEAAELPGETTKQSAAGGLAVRQKTCPKCRALQHVQEKVCTCGHVFAGEVRSPSGEGEPS